ncbi:MAG TPA: right-handed parallel beta-helix repeat-containing protein [Bacteroidales bacterium]|nr:right-handed parallel beta-helix repeat-containing protein [Bacteroidales bacterium]HSA43935.1 right-handed parallel beta-helix repeat-containing protein [Bacteroidales bacterium]
MRKHHIIRNLFLIILLLLSSILQAQVYLPLSDNLSIPGNSIVKIAAGVYPMSDSGQDGLIQVNNVSNVVIDGDSVEADGLDSGGYLIRITNASHVTIKNFSLAQRFKYAVSISNSDHITITACNFSWNKVDSAGFINVWSGHTEALGGGVLCHQCDSVNVFGNIMKYQNDGVALYNSKNASIRFNDFSWNTSYGIRMYFTDSCHLHNNNAHHINRPYTDPSDCAALLMIVSNANLVEYNDLRYSGDGVFLGQYQYSNIPNNNIFRYNDCSGSPHNAIEATFAGGNVFRLNDCSRSHYGLWLGYSFNNTVDSNLIEYNHHSGIAIDRGYQNTITSNWISGNPEGIVLWEGSPISGYQNQTSHHYRIDSNFLSANSVAVQAENTENLRMRGNQFEKNHTAVRITGDTAGDSLNGNFFDKSLSFEIENLSPDLLEANGNIFYIADPQYISGKIYDHQDDPAKGTVNWQIYTGLVNPVYVTSPPVELSEPPSEWFSYPEIGWWLGNPQAITISWDTADKIMGNASVKLQTGTGWFNALSYRDTGSRIPRWDLGNYGYLSFWLKSQNSNLGGFQFFKVRLGSVEGGYFEYSSTGSVLNQSLNQWKNYVVPLFGSASWPITQTGPIFWHDVNYLEIYTDTYGVGYELLLDGVEFLLATPTSGIRNNETEIRISPNPGGPFRTMTIDLRNNENLHLRIFNPCGQTVSSMLLEEIPAGRHETVLDFSCLAPGLYLLYIRGQHWEKTEKIVMIP